MSSRWLVRWCRDQSVLPFCTKFEISPGWQVSSGLIAAVRWIPAAYERLPVAQPMVACYGHAVHVIMHWISPFG